VTGRVAQLPIFQDTTIVKYIDSGGRSPASALGSWLQTELNSSVSELRVQSGFFSVDGLSPFVGVLDRLTAANQIVNILIGSNEAGTLQAHVAQLVALLGLPRSQAQLGVVSFAGAFFHPKTYHLRRTDGSQAAYVGSANLTLPGIGALHVEAGMLLDTREGDPARVLDDISKGVDDWFQPPRVGLERIVDQTDVLRLTASGVLSAIAKPRVLPPTASGHSGGGGTRPRLVPLIRFPAFVGASITGAPAVNTRTGTPPAALPFPAVPRPSPYPPYVLFAPGATVPTVGAAALSGATLPSAYSGLVYPLTKDSDRLWRGGVGTANISVPAVTVNTLRFGQLSTGSNRPRAEFPIEMRYLTSAGDLRANPITTNVMLYGYGPVATGHKDIRMLVPASPIKELRAQALAAGIAVPTFGNVALLEWATSADPKFRLSFLESNLPVAHQATTLLATARSSKQLIGSSCWLPNGISPIW
jgi:hypothetical protein